MKTHVEFRSSAFPPYDREQNAINPGRFGKRLAEFLVLGLKREGFQPFGPIAEDWGWVITIHNEESGLRMGCGNYEEYPDGFLCFIQPHQTTLRRWFLWTIDTTETITALHVGIDRVLSGNPEIHGKRWWTYDEFNRRK